MAFTSKASKLVLAVDMVTSVPPHIDLSACLLKVLYNMAPARPDEQFKRLRGKP